MRTTLFSALVALFLIACNGGKQAASKNESPGDNPNDKMKVTTFSQQDQYPGVYSNLRMTRNYRIEMATDIEGPVDYLALLVDSVRLPINFISVDGEDRREPFTSIPGKVEKLKIYSSRNFYQSEAPNSVTETQYAKSGKQLEKGEAILLYSVDKMQYALPLGAPELGETIYGR